MNVWSKDELEVLFRLKKRGHSWGDIAETLENIFVDRSFTPNACRKRFYKDEPTGQTRNGLSAYKKEELFLMKKLKESGQSFPQIADALNKVFNYREYTATSVSAKWHSTNWDNVIQEHKEQQNFIEDLQEQDSEKQKVINSTLANQDKIIKRDKARTDVIIENVKSAIYRLPKPKQSQIVYSSPKDERSYSEEHAVVMISDLHVGAGYSLSETGGLGEYNVDIFKKRLENLKVGLLEIIERHRLMYNINHLHIVCLGDVVAGMRES